MALCVGIVGAGRSGFSNAHVLEGYPDVQIVAVAEPNRPARDAFAREFGVKLAVSDHRRLAIDEMVDAVYVCSPPSTHSAIAIDCLQCGKHVICCQPMAVSMTQAEEMIEAAESSSAQLFVALPQRYDPLNQETFRLIESDEIGYPFLGLVSCLENDLDRLNDWHHWYGTWSIGGGGVLIRHGSGIADVLQYFFGEVDAVSAVCTRFAIEPLNKAEDSCVVGLEFIEDATAEIAITGAARYSAWPEKYSGSAMRLEIYGLEGSIRVTDDDQAVILANKKGHTVIPGSEIKTDLPTDMHRDFLDSMLDGREPLATARHAKDALKVILAAYKSSQMKRRVETLEHL
jgi:UDP-N-acetyl-2-amino-2-deoxyglucuronate dehydrogenase